MKAFAKLILLIAAVGMLAACRIDSSPDPDPVAGDEVTIRDNSFSPGAITATTGTIVTWTHSGFSTHNVTSDSGSPSFSSGNLGNGDTFTVTFASAGTWDYHCTIHPGMTGSITVSD
ncbi:MAG TPA: amidase [Treponema sp.]|nr:amidase [Treponema sp.]